MDSSSAVAPVRAMPGLIEAFRDKISELYDVRMPGRAAAQVGAKLQELEGLVNELAALERPGKKR